MRNGEITNEEFESDAESRGAKGSNKKAEMRSAGQDSDPRLTRIRSRIVNVHTATY
jgi:hypothetical protein